MKEEKKSNQPKFNIYWIYGAIIFVLLGLSFFGGNDWQTMSKTNISNFEKFLKIIPSAKLPFSFLSVLDTIWDSFPLSVLDIEIKVLTLM